MDPTSVTLNPDDAPEDTGSMNEAVEAGDIISFYKKQFSSSPDDPMDDQAIIRRIGEGGDIAGAKLCSWTRRNGDDVAVFNERSHAKTLGPKPE